MDGGESQFRWRFPVAFQIIPLLFLLAAIRFFPESPRWLVKAGRLDEARYVLGRLRGEENGEADAEFEDIRNASELEKAISHSTSYWSMLTGKGSGKLHVGRRVQLVIWLQIMQEWIGIAGVTICKTAIDEPLLNHMLNLSLVQATIFRIAGFNSDKAQWISGLNTITYMVSLANLLLRCKSNNRFSSQLLSVSLRWTESGEE